MAEPKDIAQTTKTNETRVTCNCISEKKNLFAVILNNNNNQIEYCRKILVTL